jgi:hypothetical protein
MREPKAILEVNKVHADMVRLSERVDRREPQSAIWFEAERQLGLARLRAAGNELEALELAGHAEAGDEAEPLSTADNAEALTKYLEWIAEFTKNVTYWRTGSLSANEMRTQATHIERILRAAGEWQEAVSWRQDPHRIHARKKS